MQKNINGRWRQVGGGVNFEVGTKAFAEKINYLSDGKINIQTFPGGTPVKRLKSLARLKMGSRKLVTPGWAMIGKKINHGALWRMGRLDGFRKDAPLAL